MEVYMFGVTLNSFLVSLMLILLGVGIYIKFREKINKVPVKEKIKGQITHFQKYRYWYLTVTIIVLAPILYYSWDGLFNPHKINYFPGPNVPPPQPAGNEGKVYSFEEDYSLFDIFTIYFIWFGGHFIVYAIKMNPLPFIIAIISFSFFVLALTFFVNISKSKTTNLVYNTFISVFILISVTIGILISIMFAVSILGF
jgi:hypothetical protein